MPLSMQCSLCGAPAGYQHRKWLNEVRGIYVNGWDWFSPSLSGVGLRFGDRADLPILPRDRDQRYDDAGHNSDLDLTMMNGPMLSLTTLPDYLRDPTEPPPNLAPWGTLIHDACWNILVHACFPYQVNISSFHLFCISCPMGFYLVDWGHDYGGIFDWEPEPNSPTDPCFSRLNTFNPAIYGLCYAKPLSIPELAHLLAISTMSRSDIISMQQIRPDKAAESSPARSILATNCFSRLPEEVVELIIINLPFVDVISFRIAVKVGGSIPLSQTFWASRFTSGFEFQHIFEARNKVKSTGSDTHYRDWKFLFNSLSIHTQLPAFQNRKRIWGLLQPFGRVLQLMAHIECKGEPISTFFEPYLKPRIAECVSLAAAIESRKGRLAGGCKTIFTRQICLGHITTAYVSSIFFVDKQYISGIRFQHADGTEVNLGYVFRGTETILDIAGNSEMSDGIGGFILALTPRGINAVSLISAVGRFQIGLGAIETILRRACC